MWLLDTNACIRYLNQRPSPVRERLAAHQAGEVVLCDIVKSELYFGAYHSQRPSQNLQLLEQFFAQFASLSFDGRAANICGKVRADLARMGNPIGPYDVQIAATALAYEVTLVTHNIREFGRIPGLKLDDWESI
ncbi:MAG: type II toxin-antitoxin system VapC family toxin [Caldilinea sp.]|nr:type II toxin-antitoxin system VapC family toxin [Caldilinea sp.]MCB0066361.1 type II toxin-antitoxin system VapC family toxin [Caldilineaceae bacterium]MCB0040155.1 type II toxin-antitoxin system VapC family toxin [Caldilinea sp.]MCB0048290.1 type II toxin-antitoxin system VapC family toxin [Caldilinea sp.]MCB0137871.1 type II toxin-antitoxin system VapC family toxin [Caldilineaceae bacterium]